MSYKIPGKGSSEVWELVGTTLGSLSESEASRSLSASDSTSSSSCEERKAASTLFQPSMAKRRASEQSGIRSPNGLGPEEKPRWLCLDF